MAAKKNVNASSAGAMVSVIAVVAVEHDGIRYEPEEEFKLPADCVQQLADVNAIKVVGEAAPETAA